jgi:hypothetical protein
MSVLAAFTLFHVFLSVAAMVAGVGMLLGFISRRDNNIWTSWYLITIAATVVTGFLFPFRGITPAIGVGILSAFLLIAAFAARYRFRAQGVWRIVFVVTAIAALYFDWFVFVVQAFQKIPALHVLAPNGNEPVFAIVQGALLFSFLIAGILSLKQFKFLARA